MPYCVTQKLPDGTIALVRMAGKRPPNCRWCNQTSTKLCDFIVSPTEQITHKHTCDAPMCDQHATSVGPNKDYCPTHRLGEDHER